MIESNLAYEYVNNIPWDQYPAFAFSDDSKSYLDAFRNVVDKIPFKDQKIEFNDDIWNFNGYFEGINDPSLKISFIGFPSDVKVYSKFFVLYNIMRKKKISTVNRRFSSAKYILNNIIETTQHNNIHLITTEDIIHYILNRNTSPSATHGNFVSIYQFYFFLKHNYKLNFPVDLDEINKQGIIYKKLEKNEDNKLPKIPDEYFNKILNAAINSMRDANTEYNNRVTACAIVLISQLGLRLGDLLALTTDQLFTKKLSKSGLTTNYIHYRTRKPSKPNSPMLEFDIFSNPLCTEAYETLKDIRLECEFSKTNDYLYILNSVAGSVDEFPISRTRYNREYKRFMHKYLPVDCLQEWEGLKPSVDNVWDFDKKKNKRKIIYIPDTRQFRVNLCTTLYENGIHLAFIQKYMGHLSEYMMGYYVRPKDTYQENIQYSEKVIKEIAGEDITPLGNGVGKDIKEGIKKFISDNNFKVETDIKAIMKALDDKVIIRGKNGGVCIKTSIIPCSKDARTDEILCAYNLCPNLFHFYYMIDVTYINFQTLIETYEMANNNGNIRATQKELNKIKDLIRRRLIPELDELENEIMAHGEEVILNQHSSLKEIIANRKFIREEAEIWMAKS